MVRGDALRYLAGSHAEPFDLVLADPPYTDGVEVALLKGAGGAALRPGGCFVLQHTRRVALPDSIVGFQRGVVKRFGDTELDFFWREEEIRGVTTEPTALYPGTFIRSPTSHVTSCGGGGALRARHVAVADSSRKSRSSRSTRSVT